MKEANTTLKYFCTYQSSSTWWVAKHCRNRQILQPLQWGVNRLRSSMTHWCKTPWQWQYVPNSINICCPSATHYLMGFHHHSSSSTTHEQPFQMPLTWLWQNIRRLYASSTVWALAASNPFRQGKTFSNASVAEVCLLPALFIWPKGITWVCSRSSMLTLPKGEQE